MITVYLFIFLPFFSYFYFYFYFYLFLFLSLYVFYFSFYFYCYFYFYFLFIVNGHRVSNCRFWRSLKIFLEPRTLLLHSPLWVWVVVVLPSTDYDHSFPINGIHWMIMMMMMISFYVCQFRKIIEKGNK